MAGFGEFPARLSVPELAGAAGPAKLRDNWAVPPVAGVTPI